MLLVFLRDRNSVNSSVFFFVIRETELEKRSVAGLSYLSQSVGIFSFESNKAVVVGESGRDRYYWFCY